MDATHRVRPLVVAVAPADIASRRRMLEGICRFAQESAEWDLLCVNQHRSMQDIATLLSLADGVLATSVEANAAAFRKLNCPWVAVGEDLAGQWSVVADDRAVGQMAMSHFASLGLRSVAYCGIINVSFSELRSEGLRKAAGAAGASFYGYPGAVYLQMDNDRHEVAPFHRWLEELPKPIGLLSTTCETAHIVLHHCRRLDIRVPDQIALLGVDEDEILCEATRPHLSTIDQAADEIGYRAAAMLEQLLHGGRPAERVETVCPRRVVVRESTDIVCSDSPTVARALRYIREHAFEDLSVGKILKVTPISRRALERGFKRNIGRTIHQEIVRLRLERAKQLLLQTDLKTVDIAQRCGFGSSSMLCNVFRRELRSSPREYRRLSRDLALSG